MVKDLTIVEKYFVYGGICNACNPGEYCSCSPSGAYHNAGLAGIYMMIIGGSGLVFSILLGIVICCTKNCCAKNLGAGYQPIDDPVAL